MSDKGIRERITDALISKGIPAFLEHPGVIRIGLNDDSDYWLANINGTWSLDLSTEHGETLRVLDTAIPAACDDAERIAVAAEGLLRADIRASEDACMSAAQWAFGKPNEWVQPVPPVPQRVYVLTIIDPLDQEPSWSPRVFRTEAALERYVAREVIGEFYLDHEDYMVEEDDERYVELVAALDEGRWGDVIEVFGEVQCELSTGWFFESTPTEVQE